MRAGGLRYKLRLLRPTATTNDYGAEKTTYEPTAVVWAERVKFDGSQSNEVGEHFSDYRARFNIRAAHEVGELWRVEQLGGNLYTVTNIIPNTERGYKTLVCERINE